MRIPHGAIFGPPPSRSALRRGHLPPALQGDLPLAAAGQRQVVRDQHQCALLGFVESKKLLDANFIEGMACTGGCIGGAGCLTHGPRSRAEVDKYGMEANDKTITEALAALEPKP